MIQTVAEMTLSTPPSTLRFAKNFILFTSELLLQCSNKVHSFVDINIFL
jgi:hypothetical protein